MANGSTWSGTVAVPIAVTSRRCGSTTAATERRWCHRSKRYRPVASTCVHFRCRNGSRPNTVRCEHRRRTTTTTAMAVVVLGALMLHWHLDVSGTELSCIQITGMLLGRDATTAATTTGTTGHNAMALSRKYDTELVAEIVLEVDDSGVRIDMLRTCSK